MPFWFGSCQQPREVQLEFPGLTMGPVGVGVAEEVMVVVAAVETELVMVLLLSPVAVVVPERVAVLFPTPAVVVTVLKVLVLEVAVLETVAAVVEVEEHGTESHPGVYLVESYKIPMTVGFPPQICAGSPGHVKEHCLRAGSDHLAAAGGEFPHQHSV